MPEHRRARGWRLAPGDRPIRPSRLLKPVPGRRAVLGLVTALTASAAASPSPPAVAALPLGPPGLQERRVSTTLAPGLTWTRIVRRPRAASSPAPRWLINVLAIDRARLSGRLTGVLANERVLGRETVSAMARRTGALAGVNAGFFVYSGDLAGALAIDGTLVSEPVDGRTSLLIPRSPGASPALAALAFRGWVQLADRGRLLDGVDRLRGTIPNCGGRGGDLPTELPRHVISCRDASELVLLTPRFGPRTYTGPSGVEAIVRNGAVRALRTGGNSVIPRDGYVLSGSGDAAAFLRSSARPGSQPALTTDLLRAGTPLDLDAHEAIVSAGPRLLSGGRVAIRSAAEGFSHRLVPDLFGHFVASRNPRTLAGVTPAGQVLLVTVDGRRPALSAGVTLPEAARLMRALGARDALNLDGGGSTTMVVRGRVVNHPSDPTGARPVGDGLFVVR